MTPKDIVEIRKWLLTLENHNYNQPERWLEMALDEVERLQGLMRQTIEVKILLNNENQKIRAENSKLLRVKKAAKDCEGYYGGDNHSGPIKRLKVALQALDEEDK